MRLSMYVQYPFPEPTSTTPLPFANTLIISKASKEGHTQLKWWYKTGSNACEIFILWVVASGPAHSRDWFVQARMSK